MCTAARFRNSVYLKVTLRSTILLENLLVSQHVKKFLAFYGISKFIRFTMFGTARQWTQF